MPPSDVEFARVVIGSVAALGLLGLAYFRLFGQRAKIAVVRHLWILPPMTALASAGALIAFDLPPFGRALAWLLGASSVLVYVLGLILLRSTRSALRPSGRRRASS
jgi:hypothetical protein